MLSYDILDDITTFDIRSMKMRHTIPFCLAMLALVAGCSSSVTVDVIDLNKVLDIFSKTLTELDGQKPADVNAEAGGNVKAQAVVGIEAVDEEDKEKTESFVKLFRTKLNAAKLVSTPIGVKIEDSGVINGFADKDKNNVMGAGEKSLFKIEIDAERNRVVATDNGGHYRDHSYHRSHGLFSGYFFGRMLSRNRGYYTGPRASAKPDYGKKSMSAKSYHASAVSKAKATAKASSSSYRSKSGSRGMSFGK